MIRVAVLFEYPTLYGGERSMLAAIDAMEPSEIEIIAIGPKEGRLAAALRDRGLEHVPLQVFDADRKRLPRDQVVPALTKVVQSVEPEVLHANSLSMSVLAGLLDVQVLRSGHLRDIISLSKNAIRLLNNNDRLIAVSEATRNHHVAQGLNPAKAQVVYNGVDPNGFTSQSTSNLRAELKLPDNAEIALSVGQIGLRKGLDILIEATTHLAQKLPQLHIVIVGERSSSKAETIQYEANLQDKVVAAGLRTRVHWLGYRDDVPDLMSGSTILVHSAHQEPLGRVLLEAAAAGLPIVATDVGGTSEIVQNNISARLVPPGDSNELAIGIWELTTNSGLRDQFADAAHTRAKDVFDINRSAQSLLKAWQSL